MYSQQSSAILPLYRITPFMLLCLTGFAVFFSSYLRLPLLPLFAVSLGADQAQVGLINGAFMLTAGVCSIPAGLLVDRFGCKPAIIAGIMAIALSSLLLVLCRTPGQMAVVYLFFGLGLAALTPGMLSLVAHVVSSERLGEAFGWYTTAVYIAMTVAPAVGGWLAQVMELQKVFLLSGGLLVLIALLAAPVLPQSPSCSRTDLRSMVAASRELLRNRCLLACLLATVASCVGFGVFLSFVPLHGAAQGHSPAAVGILFTAQALTNVVGRIPIGRLADRLDRRHIIAAGLVCLAVALAALGMSAHLYAMAGCAVLLGVGMALTFTAIGMLIAQRIPAAQRGLAMGMYNSCIFLGMMAGSTIMGQVLKRAGYPLGFAAAGGVALIGMALFLGMMRSSPVSDGRP